MSDTTASLVWSTTPAIANALRSIPIELLPSLVNYAFSLPYSSLSPLFKLLTSTPAPSPATLAQALLDLAEQHPETFSVDDAPDPLPPLVIAVQPGSVASFPLKLMHVDSYVGLPRGGKDVRTALVGDAAHTVHPMAGQGLNMGLGDVRGLLSTLEGIVQAGGDVGE
jgi:ubiquinone biosynthesis monooxygenase Coq6